MAEKQLISKGTLGELKWILGQLEADVGDLECSTTDREIGTIVAAAHHALGYRSSWSV